MEEDRSKSLNKYKHMKFGSSKAQKVFRKLEKNDRPTTATNLLKNTVLKMDEQIIAKFNSEDGDKLSTPKILPTINDAASKNVADLFSLKRIVPQMARENIKAFAFAFYTEFNGLNHQVETVRESIRKVSERFHFRSDYFNNLAVVLIEKAYRNLTPVSTSLLGYYYILSMMAEMMAKAGFKYNLKGEDPLGFYGKLPYDAADYVYQTFCSQEMNVSSGRLENNISKEQRDKLLLHIIVIAILVQNIKAEKPKYELNDAETLFKELNVPFHHVASTCETVGIGKVFDPTRPDKISVFLKAPLVIPKKQFYPARKAPRR